MISYARQNSDGRPELAAPLAEDHIAPAPRVSVQAFCETVETAAAVQSAGEDRRLDKAHVKIRMGGMAAAVEAYSSAPRPNVFVLEADGHNNILAGLDQLASVCDAGTRVVVIGRINDVSLDRELVRRGVSDYVIARVGTLDVVRSICNLFSAPATLERVYDFGADAFDAIFDTLRTTMPCIVLDVPHQRSGWAKRALIGADDILIVAAPDLANLRNTKNLFDLLKAARPNDRMPLYCLNQVGVPKRPEINASEFAKAIESQPIASLPFDPQMFGSAANNGQMIAELAANHRTTEMFLQIAQRLTGRSETKKPRGGFLSPLIDKLRAK